MFYEALGDMDHTFAWIDRCIEARSTMLYWIYDANNPLRKDPRFAEVSARWEFRTDCQCKTEAS